MKNYFVKLIISSTSVIIILYMFSISNLYSLDSVPVFKTQSTSKETVFSPTPVISISPVQSPQTNINNITDTSQNKIELKTLKPTHRVSSSPSVNIHPQIKKTIKLYFMYDDGTNISLKTEYREILYNKDYLKTTLEELFKGPKKNQDTFFINSLKKIKILHVRVKNKVAYPDFSKEFTQIGLGSSSEEAFFYSIVNTLCQFEGIERVRPLVEGVEIDTITGHLLIEEPAKPNFNLVTK